MNLRSSNSIKDKEVLAFNKMTQPNSSNNTPKDESPEMASPVQWTRGGTAGQGSQLVGNETLNLPQLLHSRDDTVLLSNSSEPSDQQSSSAVASTSQEQAQQLGALLGLTKQKSPLWGSSSLPPTPWMSGAGWRETYNGETG